MPTNALNGWITIETFLADTSVTDGSVLTVRLLLAAVIGLIALALIKFYNLVNDGGKMLEQNDRWDI